MNKKFKKVPFNLEYLKANPKTGIVNEDGLIFVEYYIWEKHENWVTLLDEQGFIWHYKQDDKVVRKPLIGEKQLFLMVPCKIEVMYINQYNNNIYFGELFNTKNDALVGSGGDAKYMYKFTFEDSILVSTEIAHAY